MKNGLELKAPVTDDISRALAFAIKWVVCWHRCVSDTVWAGKTGHCTEIMNGWQRDEPCFIGQIRWW